ncbi:MAG: hypothetical protein ACKVJK_20375, partial [Methylophagaceae bacterium]
TERMRIDAAGSIGFNTSDPLRPFDSRNAIQIFGSGGYTELMLRGRAGAAQNLGAFHLSIRGDVGGSNDDLMLLRFTGGTSPSYAGTSMHIRNDNGHVGIGTNTGQPSSVLHVVGGSATIPTLSSSFPFTISNNGNSGLNIISSGTTNAGQINFGDADDADAGRIRYDHSDSSMRFSTNASERLRIDSSGTVGIGVTPSNWGTSSDFRGLQIGTGGVLYGRGSGDGAKVGLLANIFRDNGDDRFEYITSSYGSAYQQSDGAHYFDTAVSGTANSAVTLVRQMTIESGGNVGIGTPSPSARLHVFTAGHFKVDTGASPIVEIANNSATSSTSGTATLKFTQANTQAGGKIISGRDGDYSSGSTRTTHMAFYTATNASDSEKMRITSTGNVGIGTTAPAASLQVGLNSDSANTANSLVHLLSSTASSTANAFSTLKLDYTAGGAASTAGAQIMFNQGYHSGNPDYTQPVGAIRGWKTGPDTNYGGGLQFLYQPDAGALGVLVGMTMTGAGKVGIGTTSPVTSLSLGASNTGISFTGTNTGFNSGKHAGIRGEETGTGHGNLAFDTFAGGSGGGERMVILASGNVGIGTASPNAPLTVWTASS